MGVPAGKAVWSAGIGHQASARASWLIDPAPRLAGVATGSAAAGSGEAAAGGERHQHPVLDAGRGRPVPVERGQQRRAWPPGGAPWRAASSGAANSSKITAVASG